MENILDLEQVCDIADKVYFDVINHLDIEHKCVEDDPDTDGTRNTEYGQDLYFLIEDAIENAINYQRDREYTCPKFEPTEEAV